VNRGELMEDALGWGDGKGASRVVTGLWPGHDVKSVGSY
jgi:hypothetical protein